MLKAIFLMVASLILGPNGQPYHRGTNGHKPRQELVEAMNLARGPRRTREIHASYDAARDTTDFANYWANADRLDADSANSRAVRSKLVARSRYETANNGFVDGMHQTFATDVIGAGPKLRVTTPDQEFNQKVETAFAKWAKTVHLRRKLWCLCHAKTQDGESFGILRNNPKIKGPVGLDIVLIETEQCATPMLSWYEPGRVDGIRFDVFGNAETYDILRHHPGSAFHGMFVAEPEEVPARFVLHWYMLRRPGQHRAVPENRSTLNVGAASRRWREATIAAAETAADISVALSTEMAPDGAEPIAPMSSVDFEKRMMVAIPAGWKASQMTAEHPNAQYQDFHRSQINEQARPKSMPINKAMCDSSNHNFASGRLDHLTYYEMIDYVEREDCNDVVLDKLFDVWWIEATLAYGWNADPDEVPDHCWDWPLHAVEDQEAKAKARDVNLKNGSLSYSEAAAEDGTDFEDRIKLMARDFGVTVERVRELMMMNTFYMAFQAQAGLTRQPQVTEPQTTQAPA